MLKSLKNMRQDYCRNYLKKVKYKHIILNDERVIMCAGASLMSVLIINSIILASSHGNKNFLRNETEKKNIEC